MQKTKHILLSDKNKLSIYTKANIAYSYLNIIKYGDYLEFLLKYHP